MDKQLDQLHGQLLSITADIIKTCEENGIDYFMAWGSCLGAVRHQDIIPWDDDADMYILYKDYKKLKKAFQKKTDGKYFYQDINTDKNYFVPFSKIRKNNTTSMYIKHKNYEMNWGICVDLFPLFEYDKPCVDKSTKRKIFWLKKLAYLPYYKMEKETKIQKIATVLYKILGEKTRQKIFYKIFNSIERKGEYLLDLEGNDYQPVIMKKDVFYPAVKKKFGGMEVKVPGNYDYYLSSVYGNDYMEIPKEGSKFRYAHDGIIVDCYKSYKEYQ